MYVVDGIPISNFTANPRSALGGFDYGDGISNINLQDIESIAILKGPVGAALYGSRANNGAILIQTIKGNDTQGISVNYRSSFQLELPNVLRRFQNEFGQGNGGVYNPRGEQNWGPALDGSLVDHWTQDAKNENQQYAYAAQPKNYRDFYREGSNWTNTLQLKNTGKYVQSYFSYSFGDLKGIISANSLRSHHLNYRANAALGPKIHLDGKLNYINWIVKDRQASGENYANTQRQVLKIPRNINLEDASNFEFLNDEGQNRQNYWNP